MTVSYVRGLGKVVRSNGNVTFRSWRIGKGRAQQWKHFAAKETFRSDGKLCSRIGKGRAQQWKHFAAMETFRSDGKLCSRIGPKGRAQQWKHFAVTVSYVRGLGKVARSNGNISQ